MSVYFVGAGPGDAELITLKGQRLLSECDCCIWAGSLVNPKLLEYLPVTAKVYDSASMDLEEIIAVIRDEVQKNKLVVRLHTGDPAIYGAIAEQMQRLDEIGITYQIVPGVSSFQASAAALQMELTLPEVTQTIILSRVAGRTPVPDYQRLEILAQSRSTLCLFLSISQLPAILARVAPFYGKSCPAAVVYRASWPEEQIIVGTIDTLAQQVAKQQIVKTAMIIIGEAVGRKIISESKLYDKTFTHAYREGDND